MASNVKTHFHILAAKLQRACQVLQMYPPRHPQVDSAFRDCYDAAERILREHAVIKIAIAGREIVLGNIQIPAKDDLLKEFAGTLRKVGIEKLILHRSLTEDELRGFLDLLRLDAGELASRGGVGQILKDAGIVSIDAGVISLKEETEYSESLFRTWEAYRTGLEVVRKVRGRARMEGELGDLGECREFASEIVGLAMLEKGPLLAVHALKTHDEYTFTHSVDVAMLTVGLARNLPFSEEDLREIAVAALLHDIGKECVPQEIINKPGKLTPQEWEVMSKHGAQGVRMLSEATDVGDLALIVAYEHHLPAQVDTDHDNWRPHVVSQLVALADCYDALRSMRPYSGEIPPDEAMEIIERSVGSKFDPDLFEGFARTLGYYPPGTCVRLDTGEVCVVQATNPADLRRPRVIAVRRADASVIEPPESLDLAALGTADHIPPAITEVVDPRASDIDPLNYL